MRTRGVHRSRLLTDWLGKPWERRDPARISQHSAGAGSGNSGRDSGISGQNAALPQPVYGSEPAGVGGGGGCMRKSMILQTTTMSSASTKAAIQRRSAEGACGIALIRRACRCVHGEGEVQFGQPTFAVS